MIKFGTEMVGKYVKANNESGWYGYIEGFKRDQNPLPISLKILIIEMRADIVAVSLREDVRFGHNSFGDAIDHWDEISKTEFDEQYFKARIILGDNHAE